MSTVPVLELLDASVVIDDRPVLNHLNLTIRAGEHTAILGPNGAGKSFFTRLLTQEERCYYHEDGTPAVRVFGEAAWDVFDLRSKLGIVSSDLHQRFVAGNNEGRVSGEAAVLSGFLASQGILRYGAITDAMRQQASDALARMGASHLARRWLDAMSSGEARRVLLARALVSQPKALVLDEPTTSLDIAARHDFMERVRDIARAGTTIILVTHHIEEILPEIQRVILLSRGSIVGDGPKREMLTSARLSDLFGAPIGLSEADGYYYASLRHA